MKKILFLSLFELVCFHSYCQETQPKISIVSTDDSGGEFSILKAVINEGSGKYLYLWNSNKGEFKSDRNDPVILIPSKQEDTEYTLFIKDLVTGRVNSKTINLQNEKADLRVYPNPVKDQVTIEVKNTSDKFIPENATLYSETSTTPIRSVQIKESLGSKSIRDGKVQLDMRDLPKGIYYLHLIYQNDSEKSIEKIRLKVE